MRSWPFALAALLTACGDRGATTATAALATAPPATRQSTREELGAALAVHRAGCARCHALDELPDGVLPAVRGPALAAAGGWWRSGLDEFLARHHAGPDAADVAAFVLSLHDGPVPAPTQDVGAAALARGEALFGALACGTCHAPDRLERLSQRTDFATLRTFLLEPDTHRPGTAHDLQLTAAEADGLAAWILRAQRRGDEQEVPGFAFECFEMEIADASMPDLAGRTPSARGVTQRIDVDVATRENHFALRFRATLDVPTSGEWRFTCGSDDGSWLFVDGQRVVENGAIAPHRRRSGTVQLDAGPHDLEVVFSEAAGGQSLEVLWQGPGQPQQEVPATRASARSVVFTAPSLPAAPAADAVQRGRAASRQRRCDACHEIADEAIAALPAPPPARPFLELRGGVCSGEPDAAPLFEPRQQLARQPLSDEERLDLALLADGCLSCHARDGRGGLPPAVQRQLPEREDLGDEGRLPPDLSSVGKRLRGAWIERLLAGEKRSRPYLQVRMPHFPAARAAQYAAWFAAVDAPATVDVEPPFTEAAVDLGRRMAGLGGRNCVTCHAFAGKAALGPQGMDLAIQHERLRPGWFADWVLAPTKHRPTTRMTPAWFDTGPQARAEVDAIRVLTSLGAAAPLPPGMDRDDGLVLVPRERPVLHGAFLEGLSARCIAVGSPLRTHYAFDVEHARLAWLWRGDFVDAAGTWSGRAGKLLQPLGDDAVVLQDFAVQLPGDGEARARRVLGRRMAADGHPVFRVAVGAGEYEDHSVPRLAEGGAEIVRTLRCVAGPLTFTFPQQEGLRCTVGAEPAGVVALQPGERIEVVYRW